MSEAAAPRRLILAIDGPSGTGKSSASRQLAHLIGAGYLDTGAMYRIATLHLLRAGIDSADSAAVIAAVRGLPMSIGSDPLSEEVLLAGEDVAEDIRSEEVTAAVSAIAAIPEVREALVDLQRVLAAQYPMAIIEGRDIGTVVLPNADVKVFLTATAEARAERRNTQNIREGRGDDYDGVLESVRRRDHLDSTRAASPLRPADDAQVIDTSDLGFDEVVQLLRSLAEQSMGAAQ